MSIRPATSSTRRRAVANIFHAWRSVATAASATPSTTAEHASASASSLRSLKSAGASLKPRRSPRNAAPRQTSPRSFPVFDAVMMAKRADCLRALIAESLPSRAARNVPRSLQLRQITHRNLRRRCGRIVSDLRSSPDNALCGLLDPAAFVGGETAGTPFAALSRCHAKSASGPRLTHFQAAATASRHVVIAAARSTR